MSTLAEQIPLDLGHRPAYGQKDFLVAPSNQNAVSWIDRWPEWPAPTVILYGPAACGKTHLAAVWKNKTKAKLLDTRLLTSVSADKLAEDSEHLVIDHIDPWFGDKEAETTLFHLYNILKETGRTMLLTSRMSPSQANFVIPDLSSRLRAAPAATIDSPDDALLSAVLVKLFGDRQLQIGCDVIAYILPRMERSFSAAHELVERADSLALAEKRPVSVPLMRRVLLSQNK